MSSFTHQTAETDLTAARTTVLSQGFYSDSIQSNFPEPFMETGSNHSKSSLDDVSTSSHRLNENIGAPCSPTHQNRYGSRPRSRNWGPLPDLRFEQSYLASIAGAKTSWGVAMITLRDQVL